MILKLANIKKILQKMYFSKILFSDINKYRPVYSPKDFLEVLLNLKGPNYKHRG